MYHILPPNQQAPVDELPSGESFQLATERGVGIGNRLHRVRNLVVESGDAQASRILKRLIRARRIFALLEPLHLLLVTAIG